VENKLSKWENFLVYSRYIRDFRGSGRYRSPLREEGVSSFMVDVDRGVWYDFGLGRGGNVYQLVREMEGVSMGIAGQLVGIYGGVGGVDYSRYVMGGNSGKMPLEGALEKVDGYGCYGYGLVRDRGIGYGTWYGMGCRGVNLWGREWMYLGYGGGKYKLLRKDDDGKKVMLGSGGGMGLWGEYGIDDDMVLCEGEIDAMSMRECGYRGVSLSNGSLSLKGYQLEGYRGNICIVYDADDSGRRGVERSMRVLDEMGIGYMVLDLGELLKVSDGYDVNNYLKENGNLNIIGENCGYRISI